MKITISKNQWEEMGKKASWDIGISESPEQLQERKNLVKQLQQQLERGYSIDTLKAVQKLLAQIGHEH